MKVIYTLTKEESKNIRQALEDIPVDLCQFVDCPDCEGDPCENCPMNTINHKWENMHDRIREEILPLVQRMEENNK